MVERKRILIGRILLLSLFIPLSGCQSEPEEQRAQTPVSKLEFKAVTIAEDAELWWARALGDINGDGLTDVALQNNNGHGGWLGWYEARNGGTEWIQHIVAPEAPGGGTFGAGDLDIGDIDNDGDLDILGLKHPGEWADAAHPTEIFWYSNPDWNFTRIGESPNCVKDISLVDLNNDGRLDIVTITFEQSRLSVFRQDAPDQWEKVTEFEVTNLHEGMDVGDIDGDGDPDVVANGYWIENPGASLEATWEIHVIDAKWHNQEGDWSRNATKGFCRDLDSDGKAEVFISHSERSGYPVSWYQSGDPEGSSWTEHIITEELGAAHTLQVFDFDLDGKYDVLTGVNRSRGQALELSEWPVYIFLNRGSDSWEPFEITLDGIYNGQVADLEGDGDLDIFRLPTHDAKYFEVLINQIK